MKIDILIVDLVLIGVVVIPILIFLILGGRDGRELNRKFLEEAKKFELDPDEKDQWNKNMLGLDRKKQKLLFVQKKAEAFSVEIFDLKQVRACRVLQETRSVKINGRMEEQLERVDLELKYLSGIDRLVHLYNSDDTIYQDQELLHAKKWSGFINESLSPKPMTRAA